MNIDKSNEMESAKRDQFQRYVETILSGAAEGGARVIKFVPEDNDIAVYFTKEEEEQRVHLIPIPSFADLWRLALEPAFKGTGQHVMTVGNVGFLFRLKEGRMALGEEVTIAVRELKPHEGYPFNDETIDPFKDEPWEKVRTILDSIINMGLERDCDRIEMLPGDPEVEIIYYVRGKGLSRLTITIQTYRQIVHYMREYYFVFGFSSKRFGDREYVIRPKLIGEGDDPRVVLEIEAIGDVPGSDILPDDLFNLQ